MKVVVTGASGNVGSALLRLTENSDWEIIGVARRPPTSNKAPYSNAKWHACDIGADDATRRLTKLFDGADAVVHLAWAINPSPEEPPMWHTNGSGTRNVLAAAAAAGVGQVVVMSSAAAYSPAPRWEAIDEHAPCEGIESSAYSRSKAQLETTLATFTTDHPDIAVAWVRPCAVVARHAGGEFAEWMLPPLIPGNLIGHNWVPLPLWPGMRAQFVHSDDVAAALKSIVEKGARGPFNLASSQVLDATEVAKIIKGVRVPVPRVLLTGPAWLAWRIGALPLHPGWLALADLAPILDTSRARRELDWHPKYDAPAALQEFIAGIREGTGTDSPALPRRIVSSIRSISWGKPITQSQR